MISAEEGDLESVKTCLSTLSKQSEIDLKNDIGYTSLALSCKNGFSPIAKILIKNGADVNALNNADQSVIFIACWANKADLVKLLI